MKTVTTPIILLWAVTEIGCFEGGEGKKQEILRREGIAGETLKKILAHPEHPGYRLKEPRPKPKIGLYLE